jgi:inorganic pyrophosphatase
MTTRQRTRTDHAKPSSPGPPGIPTWDEAGLALVVVETPKGSRNKLKFDPALGSFRLTRVLPEGMAFPFDFGYVSGTRAEDGDPLDVLVLMDAPVFPGCVVPSRLVGVLEAEQQEDGLGWIRNDRLLAIADSSTTQADVRTVRKLDAVLLDQIDAFFADYNRIAGRDFRIVGRRGRRTAVALVEQYRLGTRRHRTVAH